MCIWISTCDHGREDAVGTEDEPNPDGVPDVDKEEAQGVPDVEGPGASGVDEEELQEVPNTDPDVPDAGEEVSQGVLGASFEYPDADE